MKLLARDIQVGDLTINMRNGYISGETSVNGAMTANMLKRVFFGCGGCITPYVPPVLKDGPFHTWLVIELTEDEFCAYKRCLREELPKTIKQIHSMIRS